MSSLIAEEDAKPQLGDVEALPKPPSADDLLPAADLLPPAEEESPGNPDEGEEQSSESISVDPVEPAASILTDLREPASLESVGSPEDDLRLDCFTSVAYHGARELHYSRLARALIGLQVFLGTATVAAIAARLGDGVVLSLAFLGSAFGVAQLTADPSAMAREHRIFRARYHDLLAEMEEVFLPDALPRLRAKMQRYAASEPPSYRAVEAMAYNVAASAIYPEVYAKRHRILITPWQRRLAQWHPFRGVAFVRGAPGRS